MKFTYLCFKSCLYKQVIFILNAILKENMECFPICIPPCFGI